MYPAALHPTHAAPSGLTHASSAQEFWYPELPHGFDVLHRFRPSRACRYRPLPRPVSALLPFVPPDVHSLPRQRRSSRGGSQHLPCTPPNQSVIVSDENAQFFHVRSPVRGIVTRMVVP